jgi:hypothetical protein
MLLKPNQHFHPILARKSRHDATPMLIEARKQIGRDAGVERTVAP